MEAGLSFEPFAVDGEKEGDLHCSAAGASQQHHPRAELPFAAGSFYTGAEEASGGGEGAAAGAAAGAADAPGPAVGVAPDDTAAAAPPQPPAAPAALPAYADPSMPLGQAIVAMLKARALRGSAPPPHPPRLAGSRSRPFRAQPFHTRTRNDTNAPPTGAVRDVGGDVADALGAQRARHGWQWGPPPRRRYGPDAAAPPQSPPPHRPHTPQEVYQHLVTHGRRMAVGFGPKAVAPANPAPGTATRPRPYQGLTTELHRLVAAGRLKKAGVQGRKENPSRKGAARARDRSSCRDEPAARPPA